MCGLVCLLGKRGREKRGRKRSFHFFSRLFRLVLDQIQFNGDSTDSSDEEAPKASVFISRQPGGASVSISAPRMSK